MKRRYTVPLVFLVFIILAAGIVAAGSRLYYSQRESYRREIVRELESVTDLKVSQLSMWRRERLEDAGVFYRNSAFSALVRRARERPQDLSLQEELRTWLGRLQASYHYDQVSLLDAACEEWMSVPDAKAPHSTATLASARQSMRSGQIAFIDFYPDETTKKVYLRLFIPILDGHSDGGQPGQPLGILRMRIEPEEDLYLLLQEWPVPSKTAETMLVRKEGDEAVYLNAPRFQKNTTRLALRVPLTSTDRVTVKAALGQEGIVEGLDYRGIPVLAVVRAVPDSPWLLISKMDIAEVYAPMRERLWLTMLFTAAVLSTLAAAFGLFWQWRHTAVYRQKHEAELKYLAIIEASADGILMADIETKMLKYPNPALCRMLGYTEQELRSMTVADILQKDTLENCLAEFERLAREGRGPTKNIPCRRKDGGIVSMDVNTASVTIDGRKCLVGLFHDITERNRAEKKLRESEERHRVLFESSRDAIMTLAPPSWNFTSGNPATVEMFATKDEAEFISLAPWELSPEVQPDGRPSDEKAREMIETAMREGSHFFEWTHRRLGGGDFPATVLLTTVKLGGETFLQATVRDITAQKRLEAEKTRLLAIIEESPDFIGLADMQGNLQYHNPAAKKMVGLPEDADLAGMKIRDMHPDRAGKLVVEEGIPVILNEGVWKSENALLHRNGSEIPVSQVLVLHRDSSGEPQFISTIMRDVTAQRRAEQTQRQLMALLEATPDFVGFASASSQRILYINRGGRQMLGIGQDEDVAKFKIFDLHPEWVHRLISTEILATAIRNGVWTGDCAFLARDGTEIPILMTVVAHTSANGEVDVVSAISRDITDRKRFEAELIRAGAAAETATRAKSEFLANMSHEIRTPMTAILGFADILAANPTPEETVEAIQIIRENGRSLLELINQILDLSKIEAGKYEMQQIACSPRLIAADVLSTMKVRADSKGLSLEFEAVEPLPERIWSDPVRLRQILVNLLGNAIKFTETGSVRVVMRMAAAPESQPRLQFEVIDTGIGMTAAQTALLFQPFTQVDASARRRFGGTGLGLAISKRLAELLDGTIEVTSTPGQGSTFRLTIATGPPEEPLPRAASPESLARPTANPSDQQALHCRILLAEDGLVNQRLVTLVLTKAGAEVVVAENGLTAVELALAAYHTDNPFQIVLMDMQMPILDGYDATRILRDAGYDVPIIALTAHAMAEDRQKCLDAGCDDYLSKPIDQAILLDMVARYAYQPMMHGHRDA